MKYTVHIKGEGERDWALTCETGGQTFVMFIAGTTLSLTQVLALFPTANVNTDKRMPYFVDGKIVFK